MESMTGRAADAGQNWAGPRELERAPERPNDRSQQREIDRSLDRPIDRTQERPPVIPLDRARETPTSLA